MAKKRVAMELGMGTSLRRQDYKGRCKSLAGRAMA